MKIRTLLGLVVVFSVAVVCVMFAPTNLGGHTTYVSTHGTSMTPHFHAGDLAIVQPAATYHVGDVAAYHSTTLRNAIVLHRIIAIHDGHFTFKGDHNNFIDPDHPTVQQLVGRLRIRIPRGGLIRASLSRPIVLFPLLVVLLAAGTTGAQRKRRRKLRTISNGRPHVEPSKARRVRPRRRLGVVVPVAAAVATAGFLMAALVIWNIPQSETATNHETYRQRLGLAYSGTAAKGAAYPDGRLTTGDPVFTRLLDHVGINLDYAFDTTATSPRVGGTYQMVMHVESATGLSRSVALTPARKFSGSHVRGGAQLDLNQVRALEDRFSAETGLDTAQATVSVEARVKVTGELARTPFSGVVTSKMDFQLSRTEMIPTSGSARKPGTVSSAGSVATAVVRPGQLSLWRLHVPASTARLALLVLFALALAAGAAVLSADRRRVALGELDAILRRHRKFLVAVSSVPPAGNRTQVQVESMRALALLAEAHEQPIVHAEMAGRHRFALSTDTTVYCYDTAPARPATAPELIAA